MRGRAVAGIGFSKEFELVLCCARTRADGQGIAAIVREGVDWDRFSRLAAWHEVVPLVCQSLGDACWGKVPDPVQNGLRGLFLANARRSGRLTAELLRLLELFDSRAIPVIPFKGPVLAETVYGSVMMRQFVDLDLLVRESDAGRAKELLMAEGYEPQFRLTDRQEAAFIRYECESAFTRKTDGATVEVHWRFAPRHFGPPADSAEMWPRAREVAIAGRQVLSLAPEDLLPALCLHGLKHLWGQLKWICDVAELLRAHPALDWDAILSRARRLGSRRILLLGVRLAADLLGADVPKAIAEAARNDAPLGRLVADVSRGLNAARDGEPGVFASLRFHLKGTERARDRMRHAFFLLTTPKVLDWETLPLPHSLWFVYYLWHPLRMIRKYGVS